MSRTTTAGTRKAAPALLAAGLAALAASCGREAEQTRIDVRFPGTTMTIEVAPRHAERIRTAAGLAQNTLDDLRRNFDESEPDSEVNRINQIAWSVELPIDTSTYQILHHAERLHRLTGGAFDITTAPIAMAWGLRGGTPATEIPETLVETMRFTFGMDKLTLREFSVRLRYEANAIDLRPLLDGYLTDRVLRRLRDNLIDDFAVTAGGVTRVWGATGDGERWPVNLPDPVDASRRLGVLRLASGQACAVSHAFRGGKTVNGRRLSTVIDPIRGAPTEGTLMAVAIAPTATDAQALATAGLVRGAAGAMEMLGKLERAELMVFPDEPDPRGLASPGFSDAFEPAPGFRARLQALPPAPPRENPSGTNAVPATVTGAP